MSYSIKERKTENKNFLRQIKQYGFKIMYVETGA